MQVQAYLYFEGRAEEAVKFYEAKLGAKVEAMMHFSDMPQNAGGGEGCAGPMPPGNKVMHGNFRLGDTQVMFSDGMCNGKPEFKGISLTITVPTVEEAEKLFAAISSEGGQVQMPMTKTFFAERFGMAADKFGVSWMVLGGVRPA